MLKHIGRTELNLETVMNFFFKHLQRTVPKPKFVQA